MSRKWLWAMLGSLTLVVIYSMLPAQQTPETQAALLSTATPFPSDLQRRSISANVKSPTISYIDSPSAMCYRPVAGTGACYLQWNYMHVTASSGSYIISMTLSIDDQIRANYSGFFQSDMYVPGDLAGPGFKVTCGAPGSGGRADEGKAYSYAIRARDTSGLVAANYGSVTCPADIVRVHLPLIQGR